MTVRKMIPNEVTDCNKGETHYRLLNFRRWSGLVDSVNMCAFLGLSFLLLLPQNPFVFAVFVGVFPGDEILISYLSGEATRKIHNGKLRSGSF